MRPMSRMSVIIYIITNQTNIIIGETLFISRDLKTTVTAVSLARASTCLRQSIFSSVTSSFYGNEANPIPSFAAIISAVDLN